MPALLRSRVTILAAAAAGAAVATGGLTGSGTDAADNR